MPLGAFCTELAEDFPAVAILAALHLLAGETDALPELFKKLVAVELLLLLKEAYRLADDLGLSPWE